MATFSKLPYFPVTSQFSSNGSTYDPNKKSLNNIKINGTFTKYSTTKVDMASTFASVASVTENGYTSEQHVQQNISITKQSVDHYHQGMIIEGGAGYRQRVVIRSYGHTSEQHVQQNISITKQSVDHYHQGMIPEGGISSNYSVKMDKEAEKQTKTASNHIRILPHAASAWLMMNGKTGRLSKMPEEVRSEIAPWFIEKQAVTEDLVEETVNLVSEAKNMDDDLKPKRSDFDMSHYVNNFKYVINNIKWMLETIPDQIIEAHHQLTSIVLETRRECVSSDTVQSIYQPDEDGILKDGLNQEKDTSLIKGFSLAEYIESTALQTILKLVGYLRAPAGVVFVLVSLVFHIRKYM